MVGMAVTAAVVVVVVQVPLAHPSTATGLNLPDTVQVAAAAVQVVQVVPAVQVVQGFLVSPHSHLQLLLIPKILHLSNYG